MSRCLSDRSIPITFSACSRSFFLIRPGVADGVGDGIGDGEGVPEAVCASALRGACEAAITAAPAAGRTFTKVRRLIDLRLCFFMAVVGGRIQYHRPLCAGSPEVSVPSAVATGSIATELAP